MISDLKLDETTFTATTSVDSSIGDYFSFLRTATVVEPLICKCGSEKFERLLFYKYKNIYRCCSCKKRVKQEVYMEEKINDYFRQERCDSY